MTLLDLWKLFFAIKSLKTLEAKVPSYGMEGLFWLQERIVDFPEIENLLFHNSLLPALSFSQSTYMVAKQLQGMLYNGLTARNDVYIQPYTATGMYCPLCREDDISAGQDPYLRVRHQFRDVTACAKHGTKLIKSTPVNSAKTGNIEVAAQDEIDIAKEQLNKYLYYSDWENLITYDPYDADKAGKENLDYCFSVKPFIKTICKSCHSVVWTTSHALRIGRSCPRCEGDALDRQIARRSDYEFIRKVGAISERNTIRHKPCGHIMSRPLFFFWKEEQCPLCSNIENRKKRLASRVHQLTGDEYEVLTYYNLKTEAEFFHTKCGNSFFATPKEFLDGMWCPCQQTEVQ